MLRWLEMNPSRRSRAAEAVRENPDSSLIDKAIGCAISRQREGHTREAVDLWRSITKIAEAGNDSALQKRAWHSRAFLLRDSDPEEAIAGFDKVLELDPKSMAAYGHRGGTKAKLGRYQEAIADFDKELELEPRNAVAYWNRGLAKAKLGRYQEAIADFDETLEEEPHDPGIPWNRGLAKAKLGRHQEAIADFDKALELDPDDAAARAARRAAVASRGLDEDAAEDH